MRQSGSNRSVQLALLRAGAAFGAMALPLAAQAQDTVQRTVAVATGDAAG